MNTKRVSVTVEPRWIPIVAAAAAGGVVTLVATPARADEQERAAEHEHGAALAIAGDVEGSDVVASPHTASGNSLAAGTGFKVRIGAQYHVPLLRFTPEAVYGYQHLFANNDIGPTFAWDTNRLVAGARLGVGELVVPSIYGHVGYGWRMTGDSSVQNTGGVAADGGIALDLRVIPHVGFGAHAEYSMIDARPYVPQWLAFGLHADVVL
jgi:hypothetical protein